jgi:CheY-like chemotaxis protein
MLDIGMPKLNGYELARRIRSTGRGVFLVAMTGWGQDEDKRRAAEAGFNRHLTKPADIDAIERLLGDLEPGAAQIVGATISPPPDSPGA